MILCYFTLKKKTITRFYSDICYFGHIIWSNKYPEEKKTCLLINVIALTKNSARSARHNMLSIVQLSDVFTKICASNASMTLNIHEITQSQNYFLDLCS